MLNFLSMFNQQYLKLGIEVTLVPVVTVLTLVVLVPVLTAVTLLTEVKIALFVSVGKKGQ